MSRWTEQDLEKFQKNSGRVVKAPPAVAAKKAKFGNVRVRVDGILFDSKLEARRYEELKLLKAGNLIEWFLMQVPIHCGGGVFYRVDFQIKWRTTLLVEPRVTFEDCKGVNAKRGTTSDNQAAINKRKQVKALWGIDVILVTAAGS